jgi:hypothetical protein
MPEPTREELLKECQEHALRMLKRSGEEMLAVLERTDADGLTVMLAFFKTLEKQPTVKAFASALMSLKMN